MQATIRSGSRCVKNGKCSYIVYKKRKKELVLVEIMIKLEGDEFSHPHRVANSRFVRTWAVCLKQIQEKTDR